MSAPGPPSPRLRRDSLRAIAFPSGIRRCSRTACPAVKKAVRSLTVFRRLVEMKSAGQTDCELTAIPTSENPQGKRRNGIIRNFRPLFLGAHYLPGFSLFHDIGAVSISRAQLFPCVFPSADFQQTFQTYCFLYRAKTVQYFQREAVRRRSRRRQGRDWSWPPPASFGSAAPGIRRTGVPRA